MDDDIKRTKPKSRPRKVKDDSIVREYPTPVPLNSNIDEAQPMDSSYKITELNNRLNLIFNRLNELEKEFNISNDKIEDIKLMLNSSFGFMKILLDNETQDNVSIGLIRMIGIREPIYKTSESGLIQVELLPQDSFEIIGDTTIMDIDVLLHAIMITANILSKIDLRLPGLDWFISNSVKYSLTPHSKHILLGEDSANIFIQINKQHRADEVMASIGLVLWTTQTNRILSIILREDAESLETIRLANYIPKTLTKEMIFNKLKTSEGWGGAIRIINFVKNFYPETNVNYLKPKTINAIELKEYQRK
jgi:nitrogen fixation protein